MTHSSCREIGANITEKEYDIYKTKVEVFRRWFSENIITDSNTVMVMPYGIAKPKYRDVAPESVLRWTLSLRINTNSR